MLPPASLGSTTANRRNPGSAKAWSGAGGEVDAAGEGAGGDDGEVDAPGSGRVASTGIGTVTELSSTSTAGPAAAPTSGGPSSCGRSSGGRLSSRLSSAR